VEGTSVYLGEKKRGRLFLGKGSSDQETDKTIRRGGRVAAALGLDGELHGRGGDLENFLQKEGET